MRTVLNVALLLIAFAVGQVAAAEVTGQQAQLLISVAKNLAVGASGEFKLTIGQMEITFTVSRDAVGNIIARPVPSTPAASIAQISIGCTVSATGALVPSTMVVINSDQSLVAYNVTSSLDGGVASLELVGGRVTNVVNFTNDKKIELTVEKSGTGGGSVETITIRLPAGTLPGQYASKSSP